MVLIRFRTARSKFYKIELDPSTTISKVKESLSKEIGNGVDPEKIKLLFKAKMLKNDQTIESLHLDPKDFILIHAIVPKPQINYGPDVYRIDSQEAFQIMQELRMNDSTIPQNAQARPTNQNGDPIIQIFRRALEIEPRALENIISMFEITQPDIRQHLDVFMNEYGLNSASFNLESIRNRTAQPVSRQRFGLLLAQTCTELGIDPTEYMNFPFHGQQQPPQPPVNLGGAAAPGYPQQPPQFQQQPPQNPINQILAQFTPEEREAIQRLQQLGNFPIELVVQMYVAADKNENMAANLLLGN